MFRNVIFDWSGTLCNDLPPVIETVNRILTHYGLEEMDEAAFLAEFRLPFGEFYRERLPHAAAEDLEALYNRFFPDSAKPALAISHAREFVEFLRKQKARLFVLSAVTPAHFHEQAKLLGYEGCFEKTYLGIRDKRHVIEQLLEENHLRREETCFIGDMRHDVDAARHAGITSIAVLTGYDSAAKLAMSKPDIMVADLLQLTGWIQRADPYLNMPVSTVGALIFNPRQQVLLVRTTKWSGKWGIPGGKIQRGETSESALRREIYEETGLEIDDIQFVLIQDCVDPEEFEQSAHFVLLNYTARASATDVILNDEADKFVWVSLAEADRMDLNAPTRILLHHVASQLHHQRSSNPSGPSQHGDFRAGERPRSPGASRVHDAKDGAGEADGS